MSVGLGMASPYLLIGLFPELIGFLPKPGAWMETFKQLMGFVLLGTVCYIFTFLDWAYVVPTLGLLIAIGAACWWVARTPLTAEFGARARAWVEAAVVVAAAWFVMFAGTAGILPSSWAFGSLLDVMQSRFEFAVESRAGSQSAHVAEAAGAARPADGKAEPAGPMTVLVECTSDWCPNCKWLEATVLSSAEVRSLIAANGVVMLKADWTHTDATEVNKLLDVLGSRQVPQLAIFSSRDPNHPVVFREMYTRQQLLQAIQKAGPSQTVQKASRPGISSM